MTRTLRAMATSTKSTSTASTISATTADLLFGHEGGRPLDLDDVDGGSFLEHLVVQVGARRPLVAADPDTAAVRVDAAGDERLAPDERVDAGAREGGQPDVPPGDRAQERERGERGGDEDDERH